MATPRLAAAALCVMAVLLAGCSSSKPAGSAAPAPSSTTSTTASVGSAQLQGVQIDQAKPGEQVGSESFTTVVRPALAAVRTVHVDTTVKTSQFSATSRAEVDQSNPQAVAVRNTVASEQVTTTIVMMGTDVYVASPSSGQKFFRVDRDFLRSVLGPANLSGLVNPLTVVTTAVEKASSVVYQGERTLGETPTQLYTATLDASSLQQSLGLPVQLTQASAQVWLDRSHRVVKVEITTSGGAEHSTLTSTLSQFDQPVSIQAPPAEQRTNVPTPTL